MKTENESSSNDLSNLNDVQAEVNHDSDNSSITEVPEDTTLQLRKTIEFLTNELTETYKIIEHLNQRNAGLIERLSLKEAAKGEKEA